MNIALGVYHVLLQFQGIDARVTPHEPCLTRLLVYPNGGVYVVPRTVLIEGTSQCIAIGTFGAVGYGNTDCHATRQFGVYADVPIEFAVTFDTLGGPGTVVGPRETFDCQGRAQVCPVHHIAGGVNAPFLHPEEIGFVFVVACKDIQYGIAHV